jgi:uncharacterized integral membrane protein (TIGR00697 family)
MKSLNKREIVSTAFVVSLLISNILAVKLMLIGPLVLPAAVIIYPFCFMLGDIITEVWGYGYARKVILAGFFANAALVLFSYLGGLLPAAPVWPYQDAYMNIFAMVPRIVVASFIAYLLGELLNSYSLEKIKSWTGVRLLFVRTIGSSLIGQLVDTGIFITLAFYGTIPNQVLLIMLVSQYLVKVGLEATAGTPLAYLMVKWARDDSSDTKIEEVRLT